MTAKDFLSEFNKLHVLIKNKLIEKRQWQEFAQSVTAPMDGERVQTSSDPQRMAEAIALYTDIEKEIDRDVRNLREKQKDILAVIEQLDTEEYDFLHAVYIQHLTLSDVAEKRGNSYSWATTMHGTALAKVQRLLNEKKC